MSKCVICFEEHTNTWSDGPNMYCYTCVPVREAARGTTSEILNNLYLSDMNAAGKFDGDRLCVHEAGPQYDGQCHFIPILTVPPRSKWDRTGAVVDICALHRAVDIIELDQGKKERLVVHCMGGIERSPLTVAWYLTRSKKFKSLSDAYAFLKTKRPAVSQRLFWLPQQEY